MSNMSNPHYKLIYFDIRGFGEPIRQLFHLAKVPFEDVRIPFEHQMPGKETEEWLEVKKNTPFGRLPVLKVDDLEIPQSAAILRYLARKFGYIGQTPEEEALADAIVDQFKEFGESFRQLLVATNRHFPKEQILKVRNEVFLPARDIYFRSLMKFLNKAPSGSFLVGNRLTWADLVVADNLFTLRDWNAFEDGDKEHQVLKDYQERIYSLPELEQWIKERPKTAFYTF